MGAAGFYGHRKVLCVLHVCMGVAWCFEGNGLLGLQGFLGWKVQGLVGVGLFHGSSRVSWAL